MNDPSGDTALIPAAAQPLVAGLVAVALLAAFAWLATNPGLVDHDAPPPGGAKFSTDINSATAVELAQLPGLGPATAARIVDHRQVHGPYRSVEALLDVPGIGPATLDRLRPLIRPIGSAHPGTPAP